MAENRPNLPPTLSAIDLSRCALLARQIQALALDACATSAPDELAAIEALAALLSDRLDGLARALEDV